MKNSLKSYIMFVCSMLIFGTIGIFRRNIPLSSSHLACMRGIVGALVILLFTVIKGGSSLRKLGRKDFLLLCLGGALIGFNWMFLFEAYNYTSVPVATLCYYMEPTIVILLSPLFLREKLTARKIVCAGISVAGMVLVAGVFDGGAGGVSIAGVLFGLAAAAVYSAIVIINKKISSEDSYLRTVVELASAGAVMIPYLLITGDYGSPDYSARVIVMTAILCVVHTGAAYLLFFAGMKGMKGQSIAILSYIDPVSALMLAPIFLNEALTVWGIIGAGMIIGAAIVSEIKKSAG